MSVVHRVRERVNEFLVWILSRLTKWPAIQFWRRYEPSKKAATEAVAGLRDGACQKKAVYTYIIGNYDTLKEPSVHNPDWTYHCYSDAQLCSKIWEIEKIGSRWSKGLSSKQIASLLKIEHYNFAPPDCDLVMTIDGSMQIYADLDEVVDTLWEHGLDMVIATHPKRDCVYQEALAVLQKSFDSAISVAPQMWRYYLQGYPANNGMYGTRMMIKNNRSENLRYMCEVWSQEYRRGSCRDQLSLNYAIWKTRRHGLELNIKAVDFDWLYKESGMFGIRRHNR